MPLDSDHVDLDLVPSPRAGLICRPIEGESVIVDPGSGHATVLNGFASTVWGCLDGRVTLGELVPDVAFAFDAPVDVVAQHLLAFGREIGRAGLLDNVRAFPSAMRRALAHGDTLAGFALLGTGGTSVRFPISGRKALIANWSPSCGYCEGLGPELTVLSPLLAQAEIDLVLLASGGSEENREFLERYGLQATVVLRPTHAFADPFPGMGTPAAYLVDEEGAVLAALAVGAVEVARLARQATGQPEPVAAAVASTPKYLSTTPSAGVCEPGAGRRPGRRPGRTWETAVTYEVGGFGIGVRADCQATDEVLGRAFAAHRAEARQEPPVHLSVVLGVRPGALSLLLVGDQIVVRSRSPRRVAHGLATYLSLLVDEENGASAVAGTLAVMALPAIFGNVAVLLPAALRGALAAVQPRLARAGFRLVDIPMALIDEKSGDLVVPHPRVEMDETALEVLAEPPPSLSEGAWVPPGRYPIAAWVLGPAPNGEEDFTMARAVATAWALCSRPAPPPEATLATLTHFFENAAALPVSGSALGEIIDNLCRRVAELCDVRSFRATSDTLVRE